MADAHWHPKREARRFEPPPWERDQFEELERRRQDESAAEAEAEQRARAEAQRQAEAEAERAAEEAVVPVPVTVEPEEPAARQEPAQAETPSRGTETARAEAPAAAKPQVSNAQMDAMLIQLHGEEPKVDEHLKPVGVFASAVAMLIGLSVFLWGVIAVLKTRGNTAGVVGGSILIAFGLAIAVAGFWIGWRVTNR